MDNVGTGPAVCHGHSMTTVTSTHDATGAGPGGEPPTRETPTREPSAPVPAAVRLTASTRVLWRSGDELQLELGTRSVVVRGPTAHFVGSLDRADEAERFGSGGAPIGSATTPDADVLMTLQALDRAGFLTRVADPDLVPAEPDRSVRAVRLGPDLAALATRFGGRAAQVLTARHRRQVSVRGSGRLPTLIASLLAAAGIGHVDVGGYDPTGSDATGGEVALRDAAPGGLQPGDEGRRTILAAAEAVQRAAPGVDTSSPSTSRRRPDLTILATDAHIHTDVHLPLTVDGRPHLAASVWAARAVIGPLVVPGHTSCLGCADLHRGDRDPAWPALAAQLATATGAARASSDIAVTVLAAAVTAVQALAYLDGERPATANGTLEIALPDWRLRRRTWVTHPDCPCAGFGAAEAHWIP